MDQDDDQRKVSTSIPFEAWTRIAHQYLLVIARSYGGITTHESLAKEVQVRSGMTTNRQTKYWIGDLLEEVAIAAAVLGEPPLTSLCVRRNGTVAAIYKGLPRSTAADDKLDVDDQAALDRLQCYRKYALDMPSDGGQPMLTPQIADQRSRRSKRAPTNKVRASESWEVFLSHASSDKPRVRVLRDALRDQGVSVWFDEDEIVPGDSIPLKLEQAIENSETVVACLSPSFLESEWTSAERAAFTYVDPSNRRPTLIPVLFEDCAIPRTMAHLRHIDFREPSASAVQELVAAIRRPGPARLRGYPARGGVLPYAPPPIVEEPDMVRRIRGGIAIGLERCAGDHQMLFVADLDGFTKINDMFGVEAGGLLIQAVSTEIEAWCNDQIRSSKAVGAAIVRGRDEWFVLFTGWVFAPTVLDEMAKELSQRVREIRFEEIAHDLFASACVSYVIRHKHEQVLTLMRRALTGLRAAKRLGSGAVSVGPHAVRKLADDFEESVEVRDLTSSHLRSYHEVALKRKGTWGKSKSWIEFRDKDSYPILLGQYRSV